MHKATKLYVLLGVLLAVCVAAFAVSRHEEKQEQIRNSGEIILQIPESSVTALCWEHEDGTVSLTKNDVWTCDDDAAFPVDPDKVSAMLAQFEALSAAFVIEDVEDFGQYGLDEPVCTITLTAGQTATTVTLGDFSKMDEQRYVSIGDGRVYLLAHDPMEEFDAVLRDMILDDTIPAFQTAQTVTLSGDMDCTITREETLESLCADDVYASDGQPLDTDLVDNWLDSLRALDLSDYASYNVTEEELSAFGLQMPQRTITVEYTMPPEDAEKDSEGERGTLMLTLGRDPEELTAYEQAVAEDADELPTVSCYARVGTSQIVYAITQSAFDTLCGASYDTLRHQELFTAEFAMVTAIDVALDGEQYTLQSTLPEDAQDAESAERIWMYQDTEFDAEELQTSLCALTAESFTTQQPEGAEEVSLTLHLDSDVFPTLRLTLYRFDGTHCLAAVDGAPVALVTRTQAVALIEAIHAIVL